MSYEKLKYFVWWLNYFSLNNMWLKTSKLMNAQKLIQKFHEKYFYKSQTNASRKKHKHTATKSQIPKKKNFSNFYIFFRFFFMKRFLLILTKQKWRENNKKCEFKKKSYWLIINYWLFNVSLSFFVSHVHDIIAKSQCYSKTYVNFSHKNNKNIFHKKSHFWSASTIYSAQSKKKQSYFFF